MTTTVQVARNLGATFASDLVKQAKFNTLRSVIRDYIDSAEIMLDLSPVRLVFKNFTILLPNHRKATYVVRVPVSLIRYLLGQIRNVRPEFCLQNFKTFNHCVDFTESEIGVAFFNSSEKCFDIVKKQHTIAQIAAIAEERGDDAEDSPCSKFQGRCFSRRNCTGSI